ncbi:MAG: hypothetical protein HQK62_10575 [Desulfamplus sp.]|nr:hypothetical protein [Desulfamplus sp.]
MKLNDFLKSITKTNNLPISDAGEWLFYPGMLFGSRAKWWADWGYRYTPHEGVDFAFYKTLNKDIGVLDSTVMIPAMADGIILNICDDFLGQSVVIAHGQSGSDRKYNSKHIQTECSIDKSVIGDKESIIVTAYSHICVDRNLAEVEAHICLDKDLIEAEVHICEDRKSNELGFLSKKKTNNHSSRAGMFISKGQIIGRIADTSMKKSGILPHLHISFIEISSATPFNKLNWDLFGNPYCGNVFFLNPLW